MKQYTTPTCDLVCVATNEVMNGMSQIVIPFHQDYDDDIIYDGKGILSNHSRLWDNDEEEVW